SDPRRMPVIDEADDAGIDSRLDRMEREARLLAAHEKHFLADTGTDGIDGHEGPAHGLTRGRNRLQKQQLETDERFVFAGGDDVADDTGELHVRLRASF